MPEEALLTVSGVQNKKVDPMQMISQAEGQLSSLGYDHKSLKKNDNLGGEMGNDERFQTAIQPFKINRKNRTPNIHEGYQQGIELQSRKDGSSFNSIQEDRNAIKYGSAYPAEFYMDFLERTMEQVARSNKNRIYQEPNPRGKSGISLSDFHKQTNSMKPKKKD